MSLSVKDKAEILQQVEELLNIKEELTKQVCALLFLTPRNARMRVFARAGWRLLAEPVRWVTKSTSRLFFFAQVTLLHASLEQERSKVKGLQSEQPKHQVNSGLMWEDRSQIKCYVMVLFHGTFRQRQTIIFVRDGNKSNCQDVPGFHSGHLSLSLYSLKVPL